MSRLSGPGPDAYWKRFGQIFPVIRKDLIRQQLFRGTEWERRRHATSVAAALTDAICESEGLDFMTPEPNPVDTKPGEPST